MTSLNQHLNSTGTLLLVWTSHESLQRNRHNLCTAFIWVAPPFYARKDIIWCESLHCQVPNFAENTLEALGSTLTKCLKIYFTVTVTVTVKDYLPSFWELQIWRWLANFPLGVPWGQGCVIKKSVPAVASSVLSFSIGCLSEIPSLFMNRIILCGRVSCFHMCFWWRPVILGILSVCIMVLLARFHGGITQSSWDSHIAWHIASVCNIIIKPWHRKDASSCWSK